LLLDGHARPLTAGLASCDAAGRITSTWGCPHLGHFNSKISWPAWTSLTKSPSLRLQPVHRSCICCRSITGCLLPRPTGRAD